MAQKFARIAFVDGDEGHEIVDRLANVDGVVVHGATRESIEAAVDYLSQRDRGDESEHDIHDGTAAGTNDEIFEHGDYLLSWNTGLGYVGLERKVG